MTLLYLIILFLHIVGALALFIALGLEWVGLLSLQRATTVEQAREWFKAFRLLRVIGPASGLTILLSGIYITATIWRGAAWIGVGMAGLILLAALGMAVTGPRMAAIGRTLAAESGSLSPTFRQRLQDPLLWILLQVRVGISLGIVFIMTVKPELVGALLAISVAAVLGLTSALPAWRRGQAQEPLRD